MRIRYIGQSQRRIVGSYEWHKSNEFTQDVAEVTLALELVTSPFNEFVVVEVQEEAKLEEFITGQSAPVKKRKSKKLTEGV